MIRNVITTKTMTKLTIMLTTDAHSSRTADNLTNTQEMKINSVLKHEILQCHIILTIKRQNI